MSNDVDVTGEWLKGARQSSRRRGPSRRWLALMVVLVVVVGDLIWSVLSINSSRTTGTVATLVQTVQQRMHVPASSNITATISSVDADWAQFVVTPAPLSSTPQYGFAQFQGTTWVIVGDGPVQLWCPSRNGATTVPNAVLVGFGSACATG